MDEKLSKVIDITNKTITTKSSKIPYTPTLEERETIKQLLGEDDDKFLDNCDITIMEDGNISIRTCRRSWVSLAGREWYINLKTKKCRLVSMS